MRRFGIALLVFTLAPGITVAQWRLASPDEAARAMLPDWYASIEQALQSDDQIDVLIELKTSTSSEATPRERERSAAGERQAAEAYASLTRERVEAARGPAERDLRAQGVEILQTYSYQPIIFARINAQQLRTLAQRSDIAAVHLNAEYKRDALVNDDINRQQLSTTTVQTGATKAWSKGARGQGYSVAILDDGILATHEMFKGGKIVAEACFSNATSSTQESLCAGGVPKVIGAGAASVCAGGDRVCEHGTHVAGIAAGKNQSTTDPRQGIAPDAKVIAVEVFKRVNSTTTCDGDATCLVSSSSDQLAALDWLIANGSALNLISVNMSLGGSASYSSYCDSSATITRGVNTLRNMGIFVVIAAGNTGLVGQVSSPGCIKNAITVSSTNTDYTGPYIFFNQAPLVDVLAPGRSVVSAGATSPTAYVAKSGTSMSTPHVTGALAVLKSKLPRAKYDEIEFALEGAGIPTTTSSWTWTTPRMDINRSVDVVGQSPPPPGVALPGFLPSARGKAVSYLRLMNPTSQSGLVGVTVVQENPKKILGTDFIVVPPKSAIQTSIKDIETGSLRAAVATSEVSLYIDSPFRGYAQNILLNANGTALSNLSACNTSIIDPNTFFGNIHTGLIPDFPSYMRHHNRAGLSTAITVDVYNATTGFYIGTLNS